MPKILDLTGRRFGKLVVIDKSDMSGKGRGMYWLCLCDCGKKHIVASRNLVSGNTKSCGCKRQKFDYLPVMTGKNNPQYKHGIVGHRIYNIWANMKQRCNNPNTREYNAYGGRGIKVCEEWMHDAKAFYDWAMTHGYRDDLTIDRIDNDKGYSPENCRWIPQSEQYANMQSTSKYRRER